MYINRSKHIYELVYFVVMVTRHTRGKIEWIDLEAPTHEELNAVMTEFNIDSRIEEEIISPTPYPIVIDFPQYLYLILHFPTADPRGGTRNQEVDFIVGKHFVITARYEVIDSIHNLHKVFEAEELLGLPGTGARTDVLVERILRRLYGAIREEIEQVSYVLDRIERNIFSGKERETVRSISEAGRVLLRFDTTLARHTEPLQTFLATLSTPEYFGKNFSEQAAHLIAERDHAAALVSSYRLVATELRITNDSLLSASQNEIIKKLTIAAFIAFPLSLVAAVFGMNVDSTPLIHGSHGFWIILAIMVAAGASFFVFFRFKKWL